MENYTIAAISTALNEGGIGIIRLSGDDSFDIVNKIYRDKKGEKSFLSFSSHTIHYGHIYDGEEMIDEVMVSVMKAPNTFTKENVVEINCHGGILVCRRILDLVIKSGAKLAMPGEFSKRAFLNGRIDLSRAEAVMDLISSKNDLALKNSLKVLDGRLFDEIKSIREAIIYEIAFIESALDDPEHFDLEEYPEKLRDIISGLFERTKKLHDSSQKGKLVKEGINTVILGKPNVGKSSLLNLLSGYERAIVTEIAGTTRDTIEEHVMLKNISLNLIDTAGIRETSDVVENIGVDRAKKYALDADLVLFVIDSSKELSSEDIEIIELIKNKNVIVIFNKIDLNSIINKDDIIKYFTNTPTIIELSAKNSIGTEFLENSIEEMFLSGSISSEDELYITNIRHKQELASCMSSFELVINSIDSGLPEDFFSIDLLNAYSSLGRIIGEDIDDDLVEEIFSKFCMGK